MIDKNEKRKTGNFFLKMIEIKKGIRNCVQNNEDLCQVEKRYGIKFSKPF